MYLIPIMAFTEQRNNFFFEITPLIWFIDVD